MPEDHRNNGTSTVPISSTPKNGRLDIQVAAEQKTDIDSTEIDPCLNGDDSKQKKQPFYENYIKNLQGKTGLSRKWVLIVLGLVVLVVILLIVIVGMSIGWPTLPHMFRYPICRDSECLRAASQVQENLDRSVSPCSNLMASVCSKYSKNSSRPLDRPVWNQKEILVQKELERLRNVISTLELPLHTGTVEWKLKHLHEACLDVDSISIDGHRPLTNIISELGGWHIIRNWVDVEFDGMHLLTKLQVRYGISPFFKIHVEPDPHVPNTHSIRISPSGLGLPDKDYYYRDGDRISTAYTEYIRDIVVSLSSTKINAAKFGNDIYNYEKRLAEITPDLVTLQNPITTYNAISLAELKLTTNTIPFFDIVQAMYPEVSISENTEVVVTSLEYLSQLAQIISSTDRRTMNGYLIWCLVREYIPFLSENYTSAMDSFNNALFGMSKPGSRWEICTRLVRKYMALASEYHLEKTYPISGSTRNLLNDTFKTILHVVKEKVVQLDDTVLLMQHLKAKLNTLSLHIGLPQSTKTAPFLRDYYNALKVLKLNLFEGMKSAIGLEKKIEERMLLNTLPEAAFLKETLRELPRVKYIPSKNAVVVPRSLVLEPFFEDGYPRPILYGRLGVEIASAILSAILPYGSLWTSDKKILSPFHMTVNESVKSVQPSIDCLSSIISESSKFDVPSMRASETALTVLTELSALKIAHEALLVASNMEPHRHYSGLEQYDESALYYLSFAQALCSDSTSEYQSYENLIYFELPSEIVLNLAWTQLAEFPKAFDCAPSKTKRCDHIF